MLSILIEILSSMLTAIVLLIGIYFVPLMFEPFQYKTDREIAIESYGLCALNELTQDEIEYFLRIEKDSLLYSAKKMRYEFHKLAYEIRHKK